jgi:hypothetical protein
LLFDGQPLRNNVCLSPLNDFDTLDLLSHIDPSLIMNPMNPTSPSHTDTTRASEDNRANELNPLKTFKGSSSPSWNPQIHVDSIGDLGAYDQLKFEPSNYLPTPPLENGPTRNWLFFHGNAPYTPPPPDAGPSKAGTTIYAPSPLGAASGREHKRIREDAFSDKESECEAQRPTTKRMRRASSKRHARSEEQEKGSFHCHDPRCSQTFTRAHDVDRHVESVHLDAHFPCAVDECQSSFKRVDTLRRHERDEHKLHRDGCRCFECRPRKG